MVRVGHLNNLRDDFMWVKNKNMGLIIFGLIYPLSDKLSLCHSAMTFLSEASLAYNCGTWFLDSFIQRAHNFMNLTFTATAWIGRNLDLKPVHFRSKGNSHPEIILIFSVLLVPCLLILQIGRNKDAYNIFWATQIMDRLWCSLGSYYCFIKRTPSGPYISWPLTSATAGKMSKHIHTHTHTLKTLQEGQFA